MVLHRVGPDQQTGTAELQIPETTSCVILQTLLLLKWFKQPTEGPKNPLIKA